MREWLGKSVSPHELMDQQLRIHAPACPGSPSEFLFMRRLQTPRNMQTGQVHALTPCLLDGSVA